MIGITIHSLTRADREWVTRAWQEYWGADFIVNRGQIIRPHDVEAIYAADANNQRIGLLTYRIERDQCEVVTIDAFNQFSGIGTALLEAITKIAASENCIRIWLITTNDNLDALRFYQRRGFHLVTIHRNALDRSRELKPSIPMVGEYHIPLRDEIELEMMLR